MFAFNASKPTPVLLLAVEFSKQSCPTATLLVPVTVVNKALEPTAVLLLAVVALVPLYFVQLSLQLVQL